MKPNKHLEEIENFFKIDPYYRLYVSDTKWLISRVKTLTEALEFIQLTAGHTSPCQLSSHCEAECEFSNVARIALEEE